MSGFAGMGRNRSPEEIRDRDCHCYTCGRDIHHLGIARHRAMHRDRNETCRIMFSDGRVFTYKFGD